MSNQSSSILGVLGIIVIGIAVFFLVNGKTNENVPIIEKSTNKIEENKTLLSGQGKYSLDLTSSEITWEGKKTFVENWIDSGTITLKSGDITLDNNSISGANVVIDMNSIKASKTGANGGEDKLSTHLKSTDFFNVVEFPISEFTLTSITKNEEVDSYTIVGDIKIKNITKSIEFPAIVYMSNDNIYLHADIMIDRSLFDVRFGSPSFFNDIGDKAIDNNFNLKLKLVAVK